MPTMRHADPQRAAAQPDVRKGVVEHRQGDEGAAQYAHQPGYYFAPVGQHDGVVEIEVVHQQDEDADHQADASQAVFVKQVDIGVGRCSCPKIHCQHEAEGDKYGLGHRKQQCAGREIGIEQTNHAEAAFAFPLPFSLVS